MIKDGNYYFLDFDKHREKFIETFVKFYGERHRDIITQKINNVSYNPFISDDYLYDYYGSFIGQHNEEIAKAFLKSEGIDNPSDDLINFVFNKEGISQLIVALVYGENCLNKPNKYSTIQREEIEKIQKRIGKEFGIKPITYDDCRKLYNRFHVFLNKYRQEHPCDVFNDINKLKENKNRLLQDYLKEISKGYVNLSVKDQELLDKPNFDTIDIFNLDCSDIFFKDSICSPGYISAFTTDRLKSKNSSIYNQISFYRDRLAYYASIMTNAKDVFDFVTLDEILRGEQITNEQEFLKRLKYQTEIIELSYPSIVFSTETADEIENYRNFYVNSIYNGCKFIKNVNKRIRGHIHTDYRDEEHDYYALLAYDKDDKNSPVSDIVFNESEYYPVGDILGNLIHEINHIVSHHEALPTKERNIVKLRTGIKRNYNQILPDGKTLGNEVGFETSTGKLEENINERLRKELDEIFCSLYENPFQESDITLKDRERFFAVYDYYNFLTEKFYNKFKRFIKEHRINADFDMYFKEDIIPTSNFKVKLSKLESYLKKKLMPEEYGKRGVVDREKVETLGQLINIFDTEVFPKVQEYDINIFDFLQKSNDYKKLPITTRIQLIDLEQKADELFDIMIEDWKKFVTPRIRKVNATQISNDSNPIEYETTSK